MSLEAILDAIRSSGQAQIDEIEKQADKRVHEILANARLEAQEIREESCAAVAEPAMRERARILHRARQEALRIIGTEREALIDASLDQVRHQLSGMRMDPIYPSVLNKLTKEVLTEFEASEEDVGKALLEADPRDKRSFEAILPNLGLNPAILYELECWGGLISKSEDGRVVVINTLEARLQRALPYLRSFLSAFFEEEKAIESRLDRPGQKVLVE
ncbi:MAG: V-type ATP synthase subunit E [Anaerolineales bacterium]|jgi:vacuolar-type H+-ATPase subunit E/Vma4